MKRLFPLTALAVCAMSVIPVQAQNSDEPARQANKYIFRHKNPVIHVSPYQTTLYGASTFDVSTMRGAAIHEGKDTIQVLSVNPSGVNLGIVSRNKKGKSSADFYRTHVAETKVAGFDSKKMGQPTAIAYSPDARNVYVAADDAIHILEPRDFKLTGSVGKLPFEANKLVASPNGYYLAAIGDNAVVVYNLQDNTIRKQFATDEKVTDVRFSPDSKEMGILTNDGVLELFNTRTFDLSRMIDNLGEARAFDFNFDGKYVAVVLNPITVAVINLLIDSDREYFTASKPGIREVCFIPDAMNNTIMAYPTGEGIEAVRLINLKPFYSRLVDDEADARMSEWLKMMPDETLDQYNARVNEETRQRQRRLFEEEAATRFAGDMLANATITLGNYDRANGVLAIDFDTMPTIYLPVPEADVTSIRSAGDLTLSDVMYGVMPDDSFEIVYAKVHNAADGKTYVYDNVMRSDMEFMASDDAISIELLQQQQMEELKLQELREQVMREAKNENIISDHTQITVDSHFVPEYDAAGNRILNYAVGVTYAVDPEFSAQEDFAPGKYNVSESGAASAMLDIVKKALEGDLNRYMVPGKKVNIRISGTADAMPITHGIPYDGSYGEIEDEPVYVNGALSALSLSTSSPMKSNEQLAFVRALSLKDHMEKNIAGLTDMVRDYRYEANVSSEKGGEHRRIALELIFVDAF